MSVNFPTDRTEAGLGSGPLQQGDSWRFGSIEYTWVIAPDGTGIWSSKGINVNPDAYIHKSSEGSKFELYSTDVTGTWRSGLKVLKSDDKAIATLGADGKLSNDVLPAGFEGPQGDGWKADGTRYDPNTGIVYFASDDGLEFKTGDLRGTDGVGVLLKGSFDKVGPPDASVDPAPNAGDLWIDSTGDGWAYDGTSWTNVGDIRGPKGDPGTAGTNGKGWKKNGTGYNSISGKVKFASDDVGLEFETGDLRGTNGKGWTGGEYNNSTGKVTFSSNDGLGFTTGDLRGSDVNDQNLANVLGVGRFSGGSDIIVSDGLNSIVNNGISLFQSGAIQMQRSDAIGPHIDFTRGGAPGSDAEDFECRVAQDRDDLVLQTRENGGVFVNNGTDPQFEILPLDPENFGADTHWNELEGANDDERFAQFVGFVNNGTRKSLFVPGGKTITLTSPHTFVNKVAFVGPSAALGKNLPGIVFAHNSNVGLNCTKGIRARNFKFDGTGKKPEFESTQPTTLITVGTLNASNNEDDIDSSFRFCEFGEKHDGNILRFNGRNVNVGNCAFSNCKGGATLLKLQWDNIQEDPNNDGDAFYATSWRKNRIYNNQFHVHDSCTAIDVNGRHEIRALAVTNNIIDTGANLLSVGGAGTQGLLVSGNTWYGRNNKEEGVIKFLNGAVRSATITGNTFSGFESGTITDRPNNFIRVYNAANVRGLAITGNGFSYCDNPAISLDDASDATRTTVVGNTFVAVNGGGAAFTDGCENAANIITAN
jgi:hypothetical protein